MKVGLVPASPIGSRAAEDQGQSLEGAWFLWGRRQRCRTSAGGNSAKLAWSLLVYTDGSGLGRVQEDS